MHVINKKIDFEEYNQETKFFSIDYDCESLMVDYPDKYFDRLTVSIADDYFNVIEF